MATVFLLYEGDEWLSSDSLVLLGVFSSEKKLEKGAKTLIWERRKEHLRYAREQACKGDIIPGVRQLCDDILAYLMCFQQSADGYTRYIIEEAELDKLEAI